MREKHASERFVTDLYGLYLDLALIQSLRSGAQLPSSPEAQGV